MPDVLESPPVHVHDGSLVLMTPLEQLAPSPTNPRKQFDKGRLEELAASMQTHGVLQPLVVRPRPNGHAGFEIVAGERRFRAAKLARLERVPVIVRVLTDIQVLEAQLIENGQREDIHPIEAGDTFAALQKLDGSYSVKAIASKIGKSERYVQNVLHYAVLTPDAKKAFRNNEINAGHADLIARLKPEDQARALKACFDGLYGEDKERGVISVRQLDRWVKEYVRIDPVADAPQLPELQKVLEKSDNPEQALTTILQVAGSYSQTPATKGLLSPADYRVVDGKKDVCGHMRRALVVIGENKGKLVDICTARSSCKVHWKEEVEELERALNPRKSKGGASGTHPSRHLKDEEAKRRAARERSNFLDTVADEALKRLGKHPPTKPTTAALRVIAWDRGEEPSWAAVTMGAITNMLDFGQISVGSLKGKTAMLKPLGVDLLAIEKELAAAAAPKKGVTDPRDLKTVKKQIDAGAKKRVTMGDLGRKRGRRDGRRNGSSTARKAGKKR